jgi:hypothetical protein
VGKVPEDGGHADADGGALMAERGLGDVEGFCRGGSGAEEDSKTENGKDAIAHGGMGERGISVAGQRVTS